MRSPSTVNNCPEPLNTSPDGLHGFGMKPTTTSEGDPTLICHTGHGPVAPRPIVYTLEPSVVSPSMVSGVVMSVEKKGLCCADVGAVVRNAAVAESTTAIRLMRADNTRGAEPSQPRADHNVAQSRVRSIQRFLASAAACPAEARYSSHASEGWLSGTIAATGSSVRGEYQRRRRTSQRRSGA